MKRALAVLLLLLALSVCGMVYAHTSVDATKTQVVLTETDSRGDLSAADGVVVTLRSTDRNHHLHWETRYAFAPEPATDTDFHFTAKRTQYMGHYDTWSIFFSVDYQIYEYYREEPTGLTKAYDELLERAEPGETLTEYIRLADYYDYYPLTVTLNLPVFCEFETEEGSGIQMATEDEDFQKAVAERFSVPVPETQFARLEVTKHEGGTAGASGLSWEGGGFYYESHGAPTDAGLFFTVELVAQEENSGEPDYSHFSEGYGIYSLPYYPNEDGVLLTSAGDLAMVYPLDEGASVIELKANKAQTKLLLFTREDGKFLLTVIDIATMEALQRLELMDWPENMGWRVYEGEDFYFALAYGVGGAVVTENGAGGYELALRLMGEDADILSYFAYDDVMAWDGRRLAVAGSALDDQNWRFQRYDCGFYLAVFNEDGLAYYGKYDSSLDLGETEERPERCVPAADTPYALRFAY